MGSKGEALPTPPPILLVWPTVLEAVPPPPLAESLLEVLGVGEGRRVAPLLGEYSPESVKTGDFVGRDEAEAQGVVEGLALEKGEMQGEGEVVPLVESDTVGHSEGDVEGVVKLDPPPPPVPPTPALEVTEREPEGLNEDPWERVP